MLPKGLFGICSNAILQKGVAHEDIVRAFLEERLSPEEEFYYETSRDGRCLMGIVRSRITRVPCIVSREPEGEAIGAFDGLLFGSRMFGLSPHRLVSLPHLNPSHANGQFACAAYKPGRLRLLSDPFGTIPIYYRTERDIVIFSSSVRLLTEFPGLPHPGRDETGIAELLCLGEPLDGRTRYREIRKMRNAEMMEFDLVTQYSFSNRYWMPDLAAGDPKRTIDWSVEAFQQSVRRCLSIGDLPLSAALTGGINSRAVWATLRALGADPLAETHGMVPGDDVRIAQRAAQRLGARHLIHWIDEEFDEAFVEYFRMLREGTNRTVPASRAHIPFVLRKALGSGCTHIEGDHSCLEHRRILRLHTAEATSKEEFFEAIWSHLSTDSLLEIIRPEDRERYRRIARESLRVLVPDPEDWPAPGMAADYFSLMHLASRGTGDLASLRNHFRRSISPYLDLDYVAEASHIPEDLRARQSLQKEIVARFAPSLRHLPRCTGDEHAHPFSNRTFFRIPGVLRAAFSPLLLPFLPRPIARRLEERVDSIDYSPIRSRIESMLREGGNGIDLPVRFSESWFNSPQLSAKHMMAILPHLDPGVAVTPILTAGYSADSGHEQLRKGTPDEIHAAR